MKGKTWQGIRKHPANITMFQLVDVKLINFIHSKKFKIKDSRNLVRNLMQIIKKNESVYVDMWCVARFGTICTI